MKNTNVLSENFLSQKENAVEDLADVLETTYILSNEASVLEVLNVFVKKRLNIEELFQMDN